MMLGCGVPAGQPGCPLAEGQIIVVPDSAYWALAHGVTPLHVVIALSHADGPALDQSLPGTIGMPVRPRRMKGPNELTPMSKERGPSTVIPVMLAAPAPSGAPVPSIDK